MVYLISLIIYIITTEYSEKIIMLMLAMSAYILWRRGIISYIKTMVGYALIMVLFALFNMAFNHWGTTALIYINDVPWTKESLIYGFHTGAMVCALFLWFKIFEECMNNVRIIYCIGKYLPTIALIISMVFTYYEKFVNKIDKIREVWHSYTANQNIGKVRFAGIVFSVLLTVMLEDSATTAKSMAARSYGKFKRSTYRSYDFGTGDAGMIIITVLMAVARIAGIANIYAVMVFAVIPIIYDFGKVIEWKVYQLRI